MNTHDDIDWFDDPCDDITMLCDYWERWIGH